MFLFKLVSTASLLVLLSGWWVTSVNAQSVLLDVREELTEDDGILHSGEYIDLYEFTVTTPESLLILLESEDFDSYLIIFDSDKNKIGENNNFQGSHAGIILDNLEVGIYYVMVTSYETGKTGEYQLTAKSVNQNEKINFLLSSNRESGLILKEIMLLQDKEYRQQILQQYLYARKNEFGLFFDINSVEENRKILSGEYSLDDLMNQFIRVTAIELRAEAFFASQEGDFKKSIQLINQALEELKKVDSLFIDDVAVLLCDLGNVYASLGQYEKSNNIYNRALDLDQDKISPQAKIKILNSLGNLNIIEGSYLKAISLYKKSLDIAEHSMDFKNEEEREIILGETLTEIGYVYAQRGFYEEALDSLYSALNLNVQVNYVMNDLRTLRNIAHIYEIQGMENEAFLIYQYIVDKSQSIIHITGFTRFQSNSELEKYKTLIYATNLLIRNDFLDEAEKNVTEIINFFEKGRSGSLLDSEKISFFDTYSRYFSLLQKILINKSKKEAHEDALEIAERGRARTLVELLSKRFLKDDSSNKPTAAELQDIAKAHHSTLVTYSLIPTEIKPDEWKDTDLFIWVINPNGDIQFRSVDLTQYPRPISELIQQTRQRIKLAPDLQQDSNSPVIAQNIASTPRGGFSIDDLVIGELVFISQLPPEPWTIEGLNKQTNEVTFSNGTETLTLPVSRIKGKIAVTSPVTGGDPTLVALHSLLINPIADLLPTDPNDKVIFIPQDELFSVPFPALQDEEGKYLIDKHTILTAPSIQVLAQTQAQKQRIASSSQNLKPALVVGNPYPYQNSGTESLQYAAAEAQSIAQRFNVQPLLERQATESKVLQQMNQAKILHFATHATFDHQNGLNSAILLTAEPDAEDDGIFKTPGRITAAELFETFNEDNPLNADLVVLSACDTGQGEITGDGVVGLSRSFIAGGVPSVLVSLWSVNDASTAQLMTEFYDQWQNQGVDKATALRNAMLKTRENYPNPYHWAAFTLIGEAE